MSDLGIGTHFIWVFISMYADKGIVKVSIPTKIGVCVQGPTSEICNLSYISFFNPCNGSKFYPTLSSQCQNIQACKTVSNLYFIYFYGVKCIILDLYITTFYEDMIRIKIVLIIFCLHFLDWCR